MNRLMESLSQFCETYPSEEKTFVAPSLMIGHQITEALALAGHPWLNLRVETIKTLARELIQDSLVREGFTILSRAQALALIERACWERITQSDCFGGLKEQPGFHRVLKSTIGDLRMAEVAPDELLTDTSEDGPRIRELQNIAETYQGMLAAHRWVDETEVLRRAGERLNRCRHQASRTGFSLVPEGLDLTARERDFLKQLSRGQIVTLPTDETSQWERTARSVQIFRALGEENEVREVFRRLIHDHLPLDRTEIIYTDSDTYVPLIYELGAEHGIPSTFAEGIPVYFSRPGQAVLSYLDWLYGDYDADSLRRMIGSDVVDLDQFTRGGEPAGPVHGARVIRDAAIGHGRERHLARLDELMKTYEERLHFEEEDRARQGHVESHARQVATGEALHSLVERLLVITPETGLDGAVAFRQLAAGAAEFVRNVARVASELDGIARIGLMDLFDELSILPDIRLDPREGIRRLREAVKTTSVDPSTPKPGHLHVSHFRTGGYSGRSNTFILGLDQSRHPGAGLQDPLLLDSERIRINGVIAPRHLPLLAERPRQDKESMRACLARVRGQVTLSYSCRSLVEDRQQFPATLLLEIYRSLSSQPEADYTALRLALGPPVGFIPNGDVDLDEGEWWIRRFRELGARGEPAGEIVRSVYPWLKNGWYARLERASNRFTPFDGWVRDCQGALDPRTNGRVISCTEIETLARCPFAYFLRYALEIEPPNDWLRDPTVWLDAMEFGQLLHEIFYIFMAEITAQNEKPRFTDHWDHLKRVADECIERWRSRVPPPNAVAFGTQVNDVLLACRTFLKDEEQHCQPITPCYFEVPFGHPDAESAASIASREPVSIELGEGVDVFLRGRVDRVDLRGNDDYEVWDYKSGSHRMVCAEKQLNRGRQIQHALYARAVEILLARANKRGRVVRSGYFFPGPKGEGERIAMEQDNVALQRVLITLLDLLREGIFPYAPDPDFCGICAYGVVCGRPGKRAGSVTGRVDEKTKAYKEFEPLRRLIDCED